MQTILELDLVALIFWLCFIPFVAAVFLYLVTQHGPLAVPLRPYGEVVPPYFASVGILFALFSAFLGNDIWQRVESSNHALEKETASVQSIVQIARSLDRDGWPILSNTRRYVNATIDNELTEGGQARSAIADTALEAVAREIIHLPQDHGSTTAAQGAMLAAYERIWEARTTRRHIAATHSDPHKWFAVLFLGFLTQVALVLCHMDKPKALVAALGVFTAGFIVTMAALAVHERPLGDPEIVSRDHLTRILPDIIYR